MTLSHKKRTRRNLHWYLTK